MQEKDLTTALEHWMAANWDSGSVAIECKFVVAGGKAMQFAQLKSHQARALKLAKKKLIYKIADDSIGVKPFDMFCLVDAEAYLCIFWYTPRQIKRATLIDIDVFQNYIRSADRKSIPREDAELIAKYIIDL